MVMHLGSTVLMSADRPQMDGSVKNKSKTKQKPKKLEICVRAESCSKTLINESKIVRWLDRRMGGGRDG